MKEIIRFAAARNITIVPEIEMPGHCLAALAVYPHLSCSGGPFEIYPFFEGPGIQTNVFCPGNDGTFTFLEEVLTEVIDLFPSPYIHLGGDEVPKTSWKACGKCQTRMKREGLEDENELQSWFIERMARFVEGKGRKAIGWDEIMEGGLAEGAAVMSWRGVEPGIEALKAGHEVVFTPTSHCYLDYTHVRTPLVKSYAFEPAAPDLAEEEAGRILGVQGNMWTHIATTPDAVDAQVFPRLIALAEVAWSPRDRRNEADFLRRMQGQYDRLDAMGVGYHFLGHRAGRWDQAVVSETYKPLEWVVTDLLEGPGPYDVTFRYDEGKHRLGIEWAAFVEDGLEVFRDEHRGVTGARNENNVYRIWLRQQREGARYVLRASVRSEGGTHSFGSVWLRRRR
jgi:hexosaminidase